ncbi:MAG TPA: ABC transporter substrate-binding protein [Acetobacteraceae bacterium]|jgi:peptide/nickel transport system substrate-binding protein|nr:ABC transporter substrate-binding protein [Acetobacteraceae bacterium]
MRKVLGGVILAAGLTVAAPVMAQKSADTLRITWRDAVPDVTPYYNQLRTGIVLGHQAWDSLVYRDPETLQIKPLLAESFKWVDETTLEFTLRPNVTFHNGDKLTADDVAYTINSVLADKQVSTPSNYSYMDHATVVDPTHVRIELKRVFPAALDYMAMTLYIMPKAYREKVGPQEYSQHPIGAGPYKITKVNGATEVDMERYDGYYADSPKGKPAIAKLVIHEVPDSATEMAELLGGRADWIWKFSPDQFEAVGRMPNLQATRAESMRVEYLSIDAAGRTGADNPLTNQKVRQAIFYAVDRATMAKQLMQGGSRAIDTPCFPTQFGCDAAAAVPYPYDPAKAKQLLAEAGYPNGFDTELVTYDLPQWAGAMQGYLTAVGIHAKLTMMQVGAVVQRSIAGQNPLEMGSWGSYSVNDVSAILPNYFTFTGNDYTRDPEIRKLVEAGSATVDPDQRRKAYSAAIKLITEKASWMPIFTHTVTYGYSKQLNFKPYPDELPRFFLSSWK